MNNLDIYFNENYAKLYEKLENGIVEKFHLNCEYGEIINIFIKRQIDDTEWYDITTPYGYGGPIIIGKENIEALLKEYEKQFGEYCIKENIVSEFIRFHPICKNHKYLEKTYDIQLDRYTLGTNIEKYEDPIISEFSKSCRKNIRRALKAGVRFEIIEKVNDSKEFIDIYHSTMDRNKAAEFYYFEKEYFEEAIKFFKENIILVKAIFEEKTIAAGFYFVWNGIVHIHLSGTLSEYLYLSPAYILRYAVTLWSKEKGYKLIHHGGGRTNSEEDSLYKFKKSFSKNTEFEFYIGKKIWNIEKYMELSKGIQHDIKFFPKYRYKES